MRLLTVFLLVICVSGCSVFDAGTLGTFQQWTFPLSESIFDREITSFYQKHLTYTIPNKWKDFDDWEKRGYRFLHGKIIYFNHSPEEMYYVTYFGTEPNSFGNDSDSSITTLAVRAVNNGNTNWKTIDDYKGNKNEIDRINTRFYKEIITKLENQMNVKSRKTTY